MSEPIVTNAGHCFPLPERIIVTKSNQIAVRYIIKMERVTRPLLASLCFGFLSDFSFSLNSLSLKSHESRNATILIITGKSAL